MEGEELSVFAVADGRDAVFLLPARDHKPIGEGDTGPNTGGMGAYSPAPVIDDALHRRIMEQVIRPTVDGMAADGAPFSGFLYAGLMISAGGEPRVLEYNVRFGDPETQPILMRLLSDLPELCLAALEGRLDRVTAEWDTRACLGVVLAAGGYPGRYASGQRIHGLDRPFPENIKVFHAGTRLEGDTVLTAGGRVLCVCALGRDVTGAQADAYAACARIGWDGMYRRNDIGYRAVERERAA
jgi:phosphoribosylamine--glycine ligase